jgi:uncharacterized protein
LIGVLMVNALGYHDAPAGRLLGQAEPAESVLAQLLSGGVAALVQGKAYPVLSFLFGMGLAYVARGLAIEAAAERSRRRSRRLLLLGIVHGTLLYFGDILTLYALVALSLVPHLRERWPPLRRRIARAFAWAALSWLAGVLVVVIGGRQDEVVTLGSASGVAAFVELNATLYASAQLSALLFAWPLVRLLMLLGLAATRLRLLTHRRWRCLLRRALRPAIGPALALNAGYGALHVHTADSLGGFALEAASALWCVPLAACYVGAAALAWQRGRRAWAHALAPLGQRTLTLYVAASLINLLCFSGAGLALRPSTVQWVGLSLALWLCAWVLARRSSGRWPLEAWMARR